MPPGLKEQILAERKVVLLPAPERRVLAPWLAVAAGIILLLCVVPFALRRDGAPSNFAACRRQMVREALSPYFMDLRATNQDSVRAFLAQKSAPANYILPAGLAAQARLVGCGVKSWDNAPGLDALFPLGAAVASR